MAERMTGKITPLYIVCSPRRCVGKTLIARLLTEFYVVKDRPVLAFDLADEGPQLTDYLPKVAAIADIGDIRGQMAWTGVNFLFEEIAAKRPRLLHELVPKSARVAVLVNSANAAATSMARPD